MLLACHSDHAQAALHVLPHAHVQLSLSATSLSSNSRCYTLHSPPRPKSILCCAPASTRPELTEAIPGDKPDKIAVLTKRGKTSTLSNVIVPASGYSPIWPISPERGCSFSSRMKCMACAAHLGCSAAALLTSSRLASHTAG